MTEPVFIETDHATLTDSANECDSSSNISLTEPSGTDAS